MTDDVRPSTHARVDVFSLLSFVLGCVSLLDLLAAKVLVPIVDGPSFANNIDALATGLGILNLCEGALIVVGVIFAHVGYRRTASGMRGRALAVAGLVLGYALLALYVSRIVVAIIAAITFPHYASFVQNNFYWA